LFHIAVAVVVVQTFAGFTVSCTLVLWLVAPLVPVMVIVSVPVAVAAVVEMLSVEVPEVLTEAGLKVALTPAGKLPVPRETVPLKLLSAPTVTVYVVPLPAVTARDEGDAEIVKSGIPFTIRVTVAEWASVAVVPVIVSV